MTIPTTSANLKNVRVGYHPERIRLVLELREARVPIMRITPIHNGLAIFVSLKEQKDPKKGESHQDGRRLTRKAIPLLETLLQMEADDGKEDTAFFTKAVNAYRAQDWSRTIENLDHLIKNYPPGRYTERAYFLLAKSYEQLYSHSVSTHMSKIKGHYEDAINRFPTSIYASDALLTIGNLFFKTKNYYEALGYYNLVSKKEKDSVTALRALIQKTKILSLKKKREEALSVLRYVISRYPDSPEGTEAKIEISKILYEMNSFRKSLQALSELKTKNPENVYQYPEISLYLGNNYYQMGDNARARENLFRFYNSSPDSEMNHLVFTKIADTYRDEGLVQDGTKLYQLVLERYPDSEGALISRIRLAEQQEEGELQIKRGIAPKVKIVGTEIGLPREMYENVMNDLLKKGKKSPLAQLALLKLAILYQKEKDYDKSLKALKDLLREYPWTSLRKESKHVLLWTIQAILNEEMERKRYINIINIYHREKELFFMVKSPDAFLTIARASKQLNLEDMALEMFKNADALLADKEKPPDLLFLISEDLFKEEKPKDTLARLNLFIDQFPTEKYASQAYHLKGKILSQQKRYPQALEMFSSALRYDLRRCEKAKIFIDKAKALMASHANKEALKATQRADKLKGICDSSDRHTVQQVGDLYFHLGYPQKALSVFNQALEGEDEMENRIMLKLKLAWCYRRLNKNKEYLALYNELSSLDDPFWSNLAKERIEEIKFNMEITDSANPPSPFRGRGLGEELEKRG
jgi:TolA-binding protein